MGFTAAQHLGVPQNSCSVAGFVFAQQVWQECARSLGGEAKGRGPDGPLATSALR